MTTDTVTAATTEASVSTASVIGANPPTFNAASFDRTASYLARDAVVSYLATIAGRSEALLAALAEPDALACGGKRLAEAVHILIGSAGMFGFDRLTFIGRQFENAARCGAADVPDLAGQLYHALQDTLQAITVIVSGHK